MDKQVLKYGRLETLALIETYDDFFQEDYDYVGLNNLDDILEERRATSCQVQLPQGW